MDPSVAEAVRSAPSRSGIYVFHDGDGRALYVGKAKSLRQRLAHYLRSSGDSRIDLMIEAARSLEWVVTDTEAEALLLENTWIKEKKPRYNILLRDDKTYPRLKLTVKDEYPRIVYTRRLRGDGAAYFGPYHPAGVAKRAVRLVQKLFRIRVCRIKIDGSLPRPCLYYDTRRCLGPCVSGLTNEEEYSRAVAQAQLFLEGKNDELLRSLRREMWEASDRDAFEEAARVRDAISEIEALSEERKLTSLAEGDVDVFGVHAGSGQAVVSILLVRRGQLLDRQEFYWKGEAATEARAVLGELLPQIYDRTAALPRELHLPFAVEGEEALAQWLSERRGGRVYLRLPSRGPKARRLALAQRNARLAYERRFGSDLEDTPGLADLKTRLALPDVPRRIEGFDVSHFQGAAPVASLVVWERGRFLKSGYRSFHLRGLESADDFAGIRQSVFRAYRRRLDENLVIPDLILVDGGRGQLGSALEALTELELENVPLLALAKREEEVFLPGEPEPKRWVRSSPGLRLLQAVRDEAHRFAVDRHRRLRKKRTLMSRLDDLHGVGPGRRKLLLSEFGSFEAVRKAALPDLCRSLGPSLGASVFRQLRGLPSDEGDPTRSKSGRIGRSQASQAERDGSRKDETPE